MTYNIVVKNLVNKIILSEFNPTVNVLKTYLFIPAIGS